MDDEEIKEKYGGSDSECPRCGLRSYGDVCPNCGTPIIDNTDDEEEEYDWREHRR